MESGRPAPTHPTPAFGNSSDSRASFPLRSNLDRLLGGNGGAANADEGVIVIVVAKLAGIHTPKAHRFRCVVAPRCARGYNAQINFVRV
jgi:hypothetical protein